MTSLIGDFKKAGERQSAASTLSSLLPQKVSPKKLLASTIGAAQTFQGVLPQLGGGRNGLKAANLAAEDTFTRAVSEGLRAEENVTLNTTGTFVSDSDPSLANTEQGFMAASSPPAPAGQSKWKLMAQAAKQEMAVTQPEGDRMMSKARKAINALTKAGEENLEENIEMFAQKLVDTFGSLSAAFEDLDHHGREEITRSQWDAALNARGWNTEEMCGLNSAKIFSLVCRASKKPTGALTLPAWKAFFKKYLNRTAAHLLTEERPIDPGVSTLLEQFQAPKAATDTQSKPDVGENTNDGIYASRRGAFIMRPLEDLAKLQEAQDANSDEEEDGPAMPEVFVHAVGDSDLPGKGSKDSSDGKQNNDGSSKSGAGKGLAGKGREGGQNLHAAAGGSAGLGPGGMRNGVEGDDGHGTGEDANAAAGSQLGTHSKAGEGGAAADEDRRKGDGQHGALKDTDGGAGNRDGRHGRSDESAAGKQSIGMKDLTALTADHGPHDSAASQHDGKGLRGGLVGSQVGRQDADDKTNQDAHGQLAEGSLQRGDLERIGDNAKVAVGGAGGAPGSGALQGARSGVSDGLGGLGGFDDDQLQLGRGAGLNTTDLTDPTDPTDPSDANDPDATAAAAAAAASDALRVAELEATAAALSGELSGNLALAGLFDEDEEVNSEEPQGKADDFQSLVKQVFRLYATGYSKGRYVFIRNPDLSRFMEDSRAMIPGYRRKFQRIFESLFDDTIQLQCDMPGQGVRITAGLTLEWFQVFVQKVVRRVGMEVMSFFAALLESQLY